jgi:hypothetical protein
MKTYLIAAVVGAATIGASSLVFAQGYGPYPYGYGYGAAPYGYSSAPYGAGRPAYHSRYGTYPAYTYDPDPRLRGQLRSDFNRGVDTPGGR